MPFPLIPVIAAGGQLLSQGINAITQGSANRANWERAKEAYATQRRDNLTDWTMQNAYNHPSEQMKRLREAGLNPAQIYGGNTGITTAQTVKPASMDTPQKQAIQTDLGSVVQAFLQTMQTQQQTDNLREINKNLVLQGQGQNLKNLLTDVTISRQDRALRMDDIKLGSYQSIIDTSLEGQRIKNALGSAQTQMTLDENQRRALLTTQSLKEGVLRLLQMDLQRAKTSAETAAIKQSIKNLEKDEKIKDFEIQLNKAGFTRTDPAYMRMAKKIYDNYAPSFLKDWIDEHKPD